MATAAIIGGTGCTGSKEQQQNILLQEVWNTPYGVPPFGEIKLEDYLPAVKELIAQGKERVNQIAGNPEAPTFQNTIEALEFAGLKFNRAMRVFFNLNSAETNDSMQALAMELSPMLTEYNNDISLNEKLFQRVKQVYETQDRSQLTTEQKTLLENSYKGFVLSGANLSPEQKEEFRKITEELSTLGLRFEQNLLAATNAFKLYITDEADLSGLPESVREAAANEAKNSPDEAHHTGGWLFTLDQPSYGPFMMNADRRDLREQLYRAYNSRSFGGEFDNQHTILKIVNGRLKMAQLLGFTSYADYALADRMAENKGKVNDLLEELLVQTKSYADGEVGLIGKYAEGKGLAGKLMPWDFSYYTEKYQEENFDLTDEMTRPYFKLDKVQEAMFMLANKLYGLTFKENSDIPVYHPDVHAFEVYDDPARGGGMLAVLYIDYFPRPGKQGGAWMTSFRDAYVDPATGEGVLPVVSLVCNFTKPTESRPSLLSFGEVTTIFHEFGHGLHGMLGRGSYPGQTGTSVYRDFVELPSQIMENWVSEKEFLDLWAAHYETGEKMPAELIQKIVDTKRFMAAYGNVRQLQFGIGDMAWHSITEPLAANASVPEFERQATAKTQMLPVVDGTCFAPSFSHIFAGGYAAGYYSYKWAEVLEADAYAKFKAKGIFDKGVATSFRDNILTPGGSEHPMVLFVRFAGEEPTVGPLLEKMGIPAK